MAVHDYENVPVSVRSSADGSNVTAGVVINGGFFPFHNWDTGGFEDDLATIAEDEGQFVGNTPPTDPTVEATGGTEAS